MQIIKMYAARVCSIHGDAVAVPHRPIPHPCMIFPIPYTQDTHQTGGPVHDRAAFSESPIASNTRGPVRRTRSSCGVKGGGPPLRSEVRSLCCKQAQPGLRDPVSLPLSTSFIGPEGLTGRLTGSPTAITSASTTSPPSPCPRPPPPSDLPTSSSSSRHPLCPAPPP